MYYHFSPIFRGATRHLSLKHVNIMLIPLYPLRMRFMIIMGMNIYTTPYKAISKYQHFIISNEKSLIINIELITEA